MSRSLRVFLNHIELILSGAGLLVIAVVPVFFEQADFWQVAAITAIGVGVLHGLIFWGVRRRQRRIRDQAIAEIREMLADVVKNQLAVIGMYLPQAEQEVYQEELDGIRESVDAISVMVDDLSEESIQSWKTKYDVAVRNATELEPA